MIKCEECGRSRLRFTRCKCCGLIVCEECIRTEHDIGQMVQEMPDMPTDEEWR